MVNSAGCGALLKEYGHLLGGAAAEALGAKVRDVSELLAAAGPRPGAPLELEVAYDAPCHLQHAQRVHDAPLAMLRAIPGLRLRVLPGSDQCCGSAGIYAVLKPEMARAVLERKIRTFAAAKPPPDLITTGNPGCLMQIGAGLMAARLPIGVAHPVELLDWSYEMMGMYEGATGAGARRREAQGREAHGADGADEAHSRVVADARLRPCASAPSRLRAPAPLRLCALAPPDYLLINMSVTGILFDFNGVIVDDEPQHCDALITTLAEYGYPLDRDTYYRDYLGFDDRECFRFTFARGGEAVEEGRLQEAIERKNAHYERAIRGAMQLVPGAAEFIEEAALDGYQLGVVSGALQAGDRAGALARRASAPLRRDRRGGGRGRVQARPAGLPPGAAARWSWSRGGAWWSRTRCPGLAAARAAGLRCAVLTTSHPNDAFADADLVWPDFAGRRPAELPWSHA